MKFRVIMIEEYEVDPSLYPKGSTPDAMRKIDEDNYNNDPSFILDADNLRISVEIVAEGEMRSGKKKIINVG